MKKLLIFIIISCVFSGISVLGKDYKDAEPVIKVMIVSLEKFISGLEKAKTGAEVAAMLDEHSKSVIGFAPEYKKIMEKYPELNDENTHPEALKPFIIKMEEQTKKLVKIYMKLAKFMNDPAVKAANMRWQKAMSLIDDSDEEEMEE